MLEPNGLVKLSVKVNEVCIHGIQRNLYRMIGNQRIGIVTTHGRKVCSEIECIGAVIGNLLELTVVKHLDGVDACEIDGIGTPGFGYGSRERKDVPIVRI